jgi:FkbM family methyltransferase
MKKIFNSRKFLFNFFSRKQSPISKIDRFVPLEEMYLGKLLYIHDIASFNLGKRELFKSEMYKFKAKRNNPYIIDCGANLGMSVIYFKELYPEARIVAFEADDYIFKFLEKNIESFKYKNVELVNKAVWNCNETRSFLVEGGAGGRLEHKDSSNVYKDVNCISIKNYLVGRNVDFLKIDIEGAEYKVLKDCENELKNVDNIFIEYHSFPNEPQNLQDILLILHNAGFKYHIKEAFSRRLPFIERKLNVGMDLQLDIFCYKN